MMESVRGARSQIAAALMLSFAERTGLTASAGGRRYLWTDAFAVCMFLALARVTRDPRYADLALGLVDRVHHSLGRHRADDARRGWISGLGEPEGSAHPTLGGLRIGKAFPERAPGQPFDESAEWDRDGQYFHYLTKWMHALDQTSRFFATPKLNVWARELAQTAHVAFVYGDPGEGRRMYWKMSIDLKRPLVRSMGQHDPLDGYVTCLQLESTASALRAGNSPDLRGEVSDFAGMWVGRDLATTDPLGIGGLLADAYRAEQIRPAGHLPHAARVDDLLRAAVVGLERHRWRSELQETAEKRLAFREIGLAIGLHAAAGLRAGGAAGDSRRRLLDALQRYEWLRPEIEAFWLDPRHQAVPSWTEHRDINEVMLATSLLPEGFLRLDPVNDRGSESVSDAEPMGVR
jgi:hypothetical protein